jgi:hypothetical protein
MDAQEARSYAVRKIVATICDRSFGGTKEATSMRELALTGKQEDEIAWRIKNDLGVDVPIMEWSYFRTIGDLVKFVEAAHSGVGDV